MSFRPFSLDVTRETIHDQVIAYALGIRISTILNLAFKRSKGMLKVLLRPRAQLLLHLSTLPTW